jgi:hypothetical protein
MSEAIESIWLVVINNTTVTNLTASFTIGYHRKQYYVYPPALDLYNPQVSLGRTLK